MGAAEPSVLRCEWDYWSIEYEGGTVHLRDLRGLQYLERRLIVSTWSASWRTRSASAGRGRRVGSTAERAVAWRF